MDIKKNKYGKNLVLTVSGRLDTSTSPSLEKLIGEEIEGVEALTFDFTELEYVSSAGLRVILGAQKTMNKQGTMVIAHANENIREIFDITGFSDILTLVD